MNVVLPFNAVLTSTTIAKVNSLLSLLIFKEIRDTLRNHKTTKNVKRAKSIKWWGVSTKEKNYLERIHLILHYYNYGYLIFDGRWTNFEALSNFFLQFAIFFKNFSKAFEALFDISLGILRFLVSSWYRPKFSSWIFWQIWNYS